MAQADTTLIIPRRNFLVRALGFTAAGAAMSIPIITHEDAEKRIEHHSQELKKAMEDYYGGLTVEFVTNKHTPDYVRKLETPACYVFTASPCIPEKYRDQYRDFKSYDLARVIHADRFEAENS